MATLDTLQDSVNSLTASTTELVNEVQVKKATLDASVADAESAQTGAQSARDTAENHKLAAETAATSATNTAAALTGFDLEAIAESKAVTAVDVFVYDTSKDSDGGAWRKRTQGTSWYNETLNTATRGSRREFPAVAVIVAEADTVTIYDGDDPSLPMWMVFSTISSSILRGSANDVNSAVAGEAQLLIGALDSSGLYQIDFLKDRGTRWSNANTANTGVFHLTIAERSGVAPISIAQSPGLIVSGAVNDVAMTVLPNAPIDAATGLPVPTIAVATDGGLSVIKDDGTVVDVNSFPPIYVEFMSGSRLVAGTDVSYQVGSIPSSDAAVSSWRDYYLDVSTVPAIGFSGRNGTANLGEALATDDGLVLFDENTSDYTNGLAAYTTSTYNTGWMNGDIKGAFLSDTDDTDLVGSGELVTNGTFDTDTTGWTDQSSGTGSVTWNASGYMDLNSDDSSNRAIATQTVTLVVGQAYTVTVEKISGPSLLFRTGKSTGSAAEISEAVDTGSYSFTFVASVATNYITMYGPTSASTISVDNVSLRLAEEDRSVNGNGLQVFGTVTKNPVATGADLVAYSGFSASNYLEQPYNSDLDFGTGDFCVMGWVELNADVSDVIVCKVSGGSDRFRVDTTEGKIRLLAGSVTTGSTVLSANIFTHFVVTRKSGAVSIYVNGDLDGSGLDAGDVSSTNPLFVGVSEIATGNLAGSLALLRISATAPTAEQIAKIYNDEKVLFQENAQATLYGSSDAVTALAYDDSTELLHVGTSAGRSVFQGLRRVENTTTAVGNAISASNGLVVEE